MVAAGYRPAVYMSASDAGRLRPDQWGIPGLVIWVAAYGGNDGVRRAGDVTRHYTGRVDVHQYTSTGRVLGVAGMVDLNWALTGIPRNTTSKETDMELRDKVNWDEINELGPDTVGHKILSTWQNSVAARSYAQQAVAAVLADRDVDVDQLAAAVVAKQRELLTEVIREVVPDEVAEDVVRRLGEKLRPLE